MEYFNEVPFEELSFNNKGLLPSLIHNEDGVLKYSSPYEISWQSLERLFAQNALRKRLSDNLRLLINDLQYGEIHIARIFIGGSFISTKPDPDDLDILIFWHPKERINNRQELEGYLESNAHLFDKESISKKYRIQVHFHGLLGPLDTAINIASKWTILNSHSREYDCLRGIISITHGNLNNINN
ncbi:DUF6932 family protein [Pseudoalteromonas luteoviolacea]|uniref:DUF6932 family protein n=1 Tax=Pseudoalteromonas luteoviolacea TaxID=43657 RepID=UPI001B38AF73|nr:hypothetical protein [Pseudoalteromonas luteoviolacea]MBQ4839021.1 hypothetical protein [Pseudoalteromonas luteoviolacea]